jgi:hypothetical protein
VTAGGGPRDAAGRAAPAAALGPVVYAEENGALDGKAVVSYEPGLVVRRALAANGVNDGGGGGSGSGSGGVDSNATDSTEGVPNFKRFRKTVHFGVAAAAAAAAAAGGGGGRPAQRRKLVVKYADEAYDTLHQWEDVNVAARHAQDRADARVAEEMFAAEARGDGARGTAASSRGGKASAKPRAPAKPRVKAPAKPRASRAK